MSSENVKDGDEKEGNLPVRRRRRRIDDREKELCLEMINSDRHAQIFRDGTASNLERQSFWLRVTKSFNEECGQDFSGEDIRSLYKREKNKIKLKDCDNDETDQKFVKPYQFIKEGKITEHSHGLSSAFGQAAGEDEQKKRHRRTIDDREKALLLEIINCDPNAQMMQDGTASNMERHSAWLRISETFNEEIGQNFSVKSIRQLYKRIKNNNQQCDDRQYMKSLQQSQEEKITKDELGSISLMELNTEEDEQKTNFNPLEEVITPEDSLASSSLLEFTIVEEEQKANFNPLSGRRRRKIDDKEKELFLEIINRDPEAAQMHEGTATNRERHRFWMKMTETFNEKCGQDFSVQHIRALYGRIKNKNKQDDECLQTSQVMGGVYNPEEPLGANFQFGFTVNKDKQKKTFHPQTVSNFNCYRSNLSICILDFSSKPDPTKYKATLSTVDESNQPIIVSVQVLEKSKLDREETLTKLQELPLCPGVEENRVLPLLSHFGNVNFACVMFLIEKLGKQVVYRSRECKLVTKNDQGEQLCASCSDLFMSLELSNRGHSDEILSIPDDEVKDNFEEMVIMEKSKQSVLNELQNDFFQCKSPETNEMVDSIITPSKKVEGENTSDYSCNICLKKFKSEKNLVTHIKKSHNLKYYKECPFCENKLNISESMEEMYKHITSVHEEDSESEQFQEIVKEYTKSRLYCDICDKTFPSRGSWHIHRVLKHDAPQYVTCHICGKNLKDAYGMSLRMHMKSVHVTEEAICPKCGLSLKNKYYLTAHMRTHNEIPFQCETCGKNVFTRSNLKEHIKFRHLKIRKFKCEHCEHGFETSSKLKLHNMAIHTKEKPLSCDLCEYKCVRNDSLRAHMKNHHSISDHILF